MKKGTGKDHMARIIASHQLVPRSRRITPPPKDSLCRQEAMDRYLFRADNLNKQTKLLMYTKPPL